MNKFTVIIIISIVYKLFIVVNGLGSSSTAAIAYSTRTVCGIVAGHSTQRIICYNDGKTISLLPNISFEAISGGDTFFCGLKSGGFAIFCWETNEVMFQPKRIHYNATIRLADLAVGDNQVCAREFNSGIVKCWRGVGSQFPSPDSGFRFRSITSGKGFSCGILRNNSSVVCWGSNDDMAAEIQGLFKHLTIATLVAGESHVCGLTKSGSVVCKGNNDAGQSNVPLSSSSDFSSFALGAKFSCAIRSTNGLVICWGDMNGSQFSNVMFEFIIAGSDFVCGLTSKNLSTICWGKGWSSISNLSLGKILPGPCVQDSCNVCGIYTNSETLCDGNGNICKSCQIQLPLALPLPVIPTPTAQKRIKSKNKLSMAFLIVGFVGGLLGICAVSFCLWAFLSGCFRKKVCIAHSNTTSGPNSNPLGSGSSLKVISDKTRNFSLQELAAATNSFSLENKIGAGSFGIVYKGKLLNENHLVAIKRGDTCIKAKKFQEKETAFDSEVALLSRLHHKHLVGLIGFCQENEERLLVYDLMSNGSLHDHLHNNIENSIILYSWKIRIKIALDAARGLEYLHKYAVPPIIHRDVKSSNILLDNNYTAKVSDFGLSLMGPASDEEYVPTMAVGTVGYIDPEYYVLNVLTTKSDVYGLGVVLLELLTGRKAVFKNGSAGPTGVVEYAVPEITAGNLRRVLDRRMGNIEANETEAVELLGDIALQCANLEGKERPNISDVVASLERAMCLCEYSHPSPRPSYSSPSFSIASE
ncbi:hypothetical protein ACFE04_013999 [Oxalis oulophora]